MRQRYPDGHIPVGCRIGSCSFSLWICTRIFLQARPTTFKHHAAPSCSNHRSSFQPWKVSSSSQHTRHSSCAHVQKMHSNPTWRFMSTTCGPSSEVPNSVPSSWKRFHNTKEKEIDNLMGNSIRGSCHQSNLQIDLAPPYASFPG